MDTNPIIGLLSTNYTTLVRRTAKSGLEVVTVQTTPTVPLLYENTGRTRGVAAGEGLIIYFFKGFVYVNVYYFSTRNMVNKVNYVGSINAKSRRYTACQKKWPLNCNIHLAPSVFLLLLLSEINCTILKVVSESEHAGRY